MGDRSTLEFDQSNIHESYKDHVAFYVNVLLLVTTFVILRFFSSSFPEDRVCLLHVRGIRNLLQVQEADVLHLCLLHEWGSRCFSFLTRSRAGVPFFTGVGDVFFFKCTCKAQESPSSRASEQSSYSNVLLGRPLPYVRRSRRLLLVCGPGSRRFLHVCWANICSMRLINEWERRRGPITRSLCMTMPCGTFCLHRTCHEHGYTLHTKVYVSISKTSQEI